MEYLYHLGILVCIYSILAQSLNLTLGLCRMFNLAHVAFYALGAYSTALLSKDLQWGFLGSLAYSMYIPAFLALIISGISLKLTNDYFAMGTLAFAALVNALLVNWKSLTRGVLGISGIERPEISNIDLYSGLNFLLFAVSIALVAQLLLFALFRNSFARQLRAQSEHPQAAATLGIDAAFVRTLAMFFSAMFAGLAGSLYAYYINYIDPSSFTLHEMIFVVSIVIVGQPGKFWGVLAATAFLVLLPEPLRFIDLPSSILGPMRQLLAAAIVFSVLYLRRSTLFPKPRSF